MLSPSRRSLLPCALVTVVSFLAPSSAQAQELAQEPESFHWAYASFLGTGFYKVREEKEVFVLDLEPQHEWREPNHEAEGFAQVGITFEFPFTVGVHNVDVFDGALDLDNFGTVSFTPGVNLVYPATDRWTLLGYGHLGWGTETNGESQAWMWDVGIKSRYAMRSGNLDWGLFNEAFAAGFDSGDITADRLGGFGAGLDFSLPVPWTSNGGKPLRLNWDVTYRWFGNELTFRSRQGGPVNTIDDEWRIGVAIALRDGPIELGFFEFEQLGIAYRVDSDGAFRGITLNLSSPLWR